MMLHFRTRPERAPLPASDFVAQNIHLIVTFGDPAIGSHNFLVTDDGEQGTQHNQAAGHQECRLS